MLWSVLLSRGAGNAHKVEQVIRMECVPGADHYCMFSLAPAVAAPLGHFWTQEVARLECLKQGFEGLAELTTLARHHVASSIVEKQQTPHWLGGFDQGETPGGTVYWGKSRSSGTLHDSATFQVPWHQPSGQPNDCDGPNSEECMFMGGNPAAWFDFACGPKVRSENQTVGPEIEWIEGSQIKVEFNVYPLCGSATKEKEEVADL